MERQITRTAKIILKKKNLLEFKTYCIAIITKLCAIFEGKDIKINRT